MKSQALKKWGISTFSSLIALAVISYAVFHLTEFANVEQLLQWKTVVGFLSLIVAVSWWPSDIAPRAPYAAFVGFAGITFLDGELTSLFLGVVILVAGRLSMILTRGGMPPGGAIGIASDLSSSVNAASLALAAGYLVESFVPSTSSFVWSAFAVVLTFSVIDRIVGFVPSATVIEEQPPETSDIFDLADIIRTFVAASGGAIVGVAVFAGWFQIVLAAISFGLLPRIRKVEKGLQDDLLEFAGRSHGMNEPEEIYSQVVHLAKDMVQGNAVIRSTPPDERAGEVGRMLAGNTWLIVIPYFRGGDWRDLAEKRIDGLIRIAKPAIDNMKRQGQLREDVKRDKLTGALNKAGLNEKLQGMLLDENAKFGLLFVDLDKFKPVNDTYGHAAGDLILKHVTQHMTWALRTGEGQGDNVARVGGDEFVVVLNNVDNLDTMESIASRIREDITRPVVIEGGTRISVGASIGLALREDGDSLDSIMQRADEEMYRIKKEKPDSR